MSNKITTNACVHARWNSIKSALYILIIFLFTVQLLWGSVSSGIIVLLKFWFWRRGTMHKVYRSNMKCFRHIAKYFIGNTFLECNNRIYRSCSLRLHVDVWFIFSTKNYCTMPGKNISHSVRGWKINKDIIIKLTTNE